MRAAENRRRLLYSGLAVLGVMLLIFLFSAADGPKSGASSGRIVNLLLKLFVPSFETMELSERELLRSSLSFFVRKCGHFTEFAVLGVTLLLHLRAAGYSPYEAIRRAFILGTLYAASDEIHQAFVPERGPSVRDVLLDGTGVLFGCLLSAALLALLARRNKRQ